MTPQTPPPTARLTVWGLLEVGVVLACLVTITGFLGRLGWIFELTSHFRLHLALVLGALAAIWAMKRRWRMTAACGVAAAVNAALVLGLLWPVDHAVATAGPRLRLVAQNVHTANKRSDLVLEFLRRADADVLLLMEVNERWLNVLESLRTNYPHVTAEPREDNFGIALFSRLPLTNMRSGRVRERGSAVHYRDHYGWGTSHFPAGHASAAARFGRKRPTAE